VIGDRCRVDGADLVRLKSPDGCAYRYCPQCSTAIMEFEKNVQIRWRFRAGELFLLDSPDPRTDVHLAPLRNAVAEFQRVGYPFDPECYNVCRSTTVIAEAERVKLVWCDCKTGTAYGARPKYGWVQMGVFRKDGTRYVLQDYFGPSDMESVIESAVAELRPAS
jgi:hypothetical protein